MAAEDVLNTSVIQRIINRHDSAARVTKNGFDALLFQCGND
ncbi:Uncharacterised protein [Vibrio cholerae]|nr:Uncharacterised protein [Vibrio cholerae]CSC57503.1 Uncharacterised protein [Vibrio cholerae]CSD04486.1 Uncharacterised protein [Vibrio cholerae]